MIVYSEEDIEVLYDMIRDIDLLDRVRSAYHKTQGTMQDLECFGLNGGEALEFLAAPFEDVPKYLGHKFKTLVKWRLQIGR